MVRCRFVGNTSTVGDRTFDEVGQAAAFSEEQYRCVVVGGAAFIPEADFQKINFVAEELAAHGSAGRRIDPPSSFLDKAARALQVFRDIRSRMILEGSGRMTISEISNGDARGED